MSRKPPRDENKARVAQTINERLAGSGPTVVGGGQRGPFSLMIDHLSYRELMDLIRTVRQHRKSGDSC